MRVGFLLGISLAFLASRAQAQSAAFCYLTDIRTECLSNAVRVVIESDGLLQVYTDSGLYVNFEDWSLRPVRRLLFYLANAKSMVGNFAEVGRYPISHLELSIPPWSQGGVGVLLQVVLYAPAQMRSMEVGGGKWDPGEIGEPEGVAFDVRLNENKNSLIVTVISDRPVEEIAPPNLAERLKGRQRALEVYGEEQGISVEAPAKEEDRLRHRRRVLEVTGEPGIVSIYALNANIHTLFESLASVSHTPIIVDETVEHLVSTYLPDSPVEEVIHRLAATYGLSVRRVGETFLIGEAVKRELVAYNLGVTERIPLRYLSPEQAILLLPNFLLRYIHADPEQNALMITGPPEMVDKLRQDLAKIDLPAPQIQVEALSVQVDDATDFLRALSLMPSADSPLRNWSFRPRDGFLQYIDRADLSPDFTARLEALETKKQIQLRSQARTTVVNGQTGRLFLGRQRFIQVLRGRWRQEIDLEVVEEGLILEVTPLTGGNTWIRANLRPELSNIVEVDPATGMPTLAKRRADTNVLVRNGETVILGGQILHQRQVLKRRIPLLADLPLVGSLFRTRRVQSEKSDLILLVTLRVVEPEPKPSC